MLLFIGVIKFEIKCCWVGVGRINNRGLIRPCLLLFMVSCGGRSVLPVDLVGCSHNSGVISGSCLLFIQCRTVEGHVIIKDIFRQNIC